MKLLLGRRCRFYVMYLRQAPKVTRSDTSEESMSLEILKPRLASFQPGGRQATEKDLFLLKDFLSFHRRRAHADFCRRRPSSASHFIARMHARPYLEGKANNFQLPFLPRPTSLLRRSR